MVKWSDPAKLALKEIHHYIANDSKYYAKKVIREIVEKSEKLTDFSKIGRIVPELADSNIRELFIYSYRLIYDISSADIQILNIVHSKQILEINDIDLQ